MKKSKFRIKGIIAILCTIPLVYSCFAGRTYVEIEDEIFTGGILSGNQSMIRYRDFGTYGFGYFFIGGDSYNSFRGNRDDWEVKAVLEHNGSQITCYKQLYGYYTTNFLNFGMFPIDEYTASKINNGIQFITGGLYADCDDENNNSLGYEKVYGYIKRQYGDGGKNTHEIRAGITETGWKRSSNLEIVIADHNDEEYPRLSTGLYYRKNVALSGYMHDSIAKISQVTPNFFKNILINIPYEYFNNTPALQGNMNETFYYSEGINGYGLFFLGTGIDGSFEATDTAGTTLECSKQLNGYYLFNFNDFGMFPLDPITETFIKSKHNNDIIIDTGGLYYGCKQNDTEYAGLYGYIRWKYGKFGNIHEMRVGVDRTGHRQSVSPLEIIYSENARNSEVSLSGVYHTSLAKNGQVINRFFGDVGLMMSGKNLTNFSGNDNTTILIDYMDYKTNDITVYVKSSMPGTNINRRRTRRYIWPNAYSRKYNYVNYVYSGEDYTGINMDSTRSDFGFYEKYEVGLQKQTGVSNGSVLVQLTNGDQIRKNTTLKYKIINETPEITIRKTPIDNRCRTSISIRADVTNLPTSIKYKYTDTGADCNGQKWNNPYTTNTNTGEYDYTGNIVLDDDSYNGKYICFKAENDLNIGYAIRQITGLDSTPPEIDIESPTIFTGLECETIEGYVTAKDNGGCSDDIKVKFYDESGPLSNIIEGQLLPNSTWRRAYYREKQSSVGEKLVKYNLIDTTDQNITGGEFTLQRVDNPVTGKNFRTCVTYKVGNILTANIDWKKNSEAHAGTGCNGNEDEEIYIKEIKCNKARSRTTINGDLIEYQYQSSQISLGWTETCRLTIADDDGETEITMILDRNCPQPKITGNIIGGDNFVDWCYTGGYNHASGTFLYYEEGCNDMPITKPSNTQPTKYTSGSKISLKIEYNESVPLKKYRASCIENENYCKEYESGRNDIGCDTIYTGYYENIRNCTRSNKSSAGNTCNYNKAGQKCKHCTLSFLGICLIEDDGEVKCDDSSACRRGCTETPGSGYFEDILGCVYSKDTNNGPCISEGESTFLGFINIGGGGNSNGRCRRGCASNVIGRNNINDYMNECQESRKELTQDTNGGFKCKDGATMSARSDWKSIPTNHIIERDLEEGEGCSNYGNLTPNGSKFQGERTVWIQVQDYNDEISEKTESDIVVYDLGNYNNVNLYPNSSREWNTSPIINGIGQPTNNNDIINRNINVSDANLIYGIASSEIGVETSKEELLIGIYQKYIGFSSRYSIAKNMNSSWMMKGICAGDYEQTTGMFTSHINDSCTCYGDSCKGDWEKFRNVGLTHWIPAIDYGCEKLNKYIKYDVTKEEAEQNKNLDCNGEITSINCDKTSNRRLYEFSIRDLGGEEEAYIQCTDACNRSIKNKLGCYLKSGDIESNTTHCEQKLGTIYKSGYVENSNTYSSDTECNRYCRDNYNNSDKSKRCYDENGNRTKTCLKGQRTGSTATKTGGTVQQGKVNEYITYYYYYSPGTIAMEDPDNPVFYYYDNLIIKSNCQNSGFDSCTGYVCSLYNKDNRFECTYRKCLNYGDGCLSFETQIINSDTFINKNNTKCSCIATEEEEAHIAGGIVDENLYRCAEVSGENNDTYYQCYKCTKYECIIQTNKCKEDAYSKGVTYFTLDEPKPESISSHLQIKKNGQNKIIEQFITNQGGPVDVFFTKENGGQVTTLSNYNLIVTTTSQIWSNNANINVKVEGLERTPDLCEICEKGYFDLRVNTGFVKDFGINVTNSLQIRAPNKYIPIDCRECDQCEILKRQDLCYNQTGLNYFCTHCRDKLTNPLEIEKYDVQCQCNNNNSEFCRCDTNAYSCNSYYKEPQNEAGIASCNHDPCESTGYLTDFCNIEANKSDIRCICQGLDEKGMENLETINCMCNGGRCTNLRNKYDPTNQCCFDTCEECEINGRNIGNLCDDEHYVENYEYCNCEYTDTCNNMPGNQCQGTLCSVLDHNFTATPTSCDCIYNFEDFEGPLNSVGKPIYLKEKFSNQLRENSPQCSCITESHEKNWNTTYGNTHDYCTCNPDKGECRCPIIKEVGLEQPDSNTQFAISTIVTGEFLDKFRGTTSLTIKSVNDIIACSGTLEFEESESCPGFKGWLIDETCQDGNNEIEGKSITYRCKETINITVDGKLDLDGNPGTALRTGCKVKLKEGPKVCTQVGGCNHTAAQEILLSFYLKTGDSAYRVGETGKEMKYTGTLNEAISNYGGDESFYFYITNPQRIELSGTNRDGLGTQSGILGKIDYNIQFNTGLAGEFFEIEGSATIDGYALELQTKKRIFNYANPKGTLFVFPGY